MNAYVVQVLPGPGAAFLNTNLNSKKAVDVGEEITGRVEVASMRDDKPICTLNVSLRDADGDICVEGAATTYAMPHEGL